MKATQKQEELLFIAWHFAPVGGPAVHRSLNFVCNLPENGYRPVVITNSEEDVKASDYPIDRSLLNRLPAGTEIIRIPGGEPRDFVRFMRKIRLFRIVWFFFYPMFWERSARWPAKALKTTEKLIQDRGIKLVYTTSGPFSAMMLGYRLKKRAHVKWVADLRDPFTDGYAWQFPGKLHWYFCRMMEKRVFKTADMLIVNTNAVRDLYIKRGLHHPDNIIVITNGY